MKIPLKKTIITKAALLVKFKENIISTELIGDRSRYTDVTKLMAKTTKFIDTSKLFIELANDIKAYRMLTSLSANAKQRWLQENKNNVKLKPLEDVFYLAIIYCKEGNEEVLANKLVQSGLVDYAEPDHIMYLDTPPNDLQYWLQSGWEQYNNVDIDAETAWQTQTGSPNVKVAIIDTGIDYNNDDLGNGTWNTSGAKVRGGYNYHDDNSNPFDNDITSSHGTAVAGIVGAYRNNGVRIAGIAGGDVANGNNGVTLYALKAFSGSSGWPTRATGSTSAMAAALIDAAKPESEGGYGCHIANYSGGALTNTQNVTVINTLRYAARKNLLFVAAKGNDYTSDTHYPSDYRNNWVLSVGASDGADQRAPFSNWGNGIDVVAPGTTDLVYTTKKVSEGSEGAFDGTSAAAPVVAGIAALLKSQNSNLHRDDMEQLIKLSAEKVPTYTYTNGYNEEMGFGRVNAGNAMNYLKAPYKLIQKTEIGGTIEDISSSQWFVFNDGVPLTDVNYGKRYRIKRTVQKPFCSGENYFWTRVEGASLGWSGANPNNQENYISISNETATTVDLTTWVYFIETNSIGQTINTWYPCAPQDVQFAYTTLGLEEYEIPNMSISGPSSFCTDSTYSITNLPTGATVTWNAPTSLVTITLLDPEGSAIKATKVNSLSGVITATITTACNSIVLSKNISVGTPDTDYTYGMVSNSNGNFPLSYINCLVENNNPFYPNMYNSDVSVSNPVAATYQWTLESKTPNTAIAQVLDWGNGNATINVRPAGAKLQPDSLYPIVAALSIPTILSEPIIYAFLWNIY